jgi:hypothetical protein
VWDAIRFVEQQLQHDDRVLEVGSGVKLLNGDSRELFTRYFADREWEVVVIDSPNDRLSIFDDLVARASKPRLIVYDDTDEMENRATLQTSIKGYQANVFRGFKPQTVHACKTTVFTRENPI